MVLSGLEMKELERRGISLGSGMSLSLARPIVEYNAIQWDVAQG